MEAEACRMTHMGVALRDYPLYGRSRAGRPFLSTGTGLEQAIGFISRLILQPFLFSSAE